MSEISMYEAQKKKMEGLCEEHDLTYRFQKDTYPPTFTISPIQGMDAQLSMLENVEEAGYISPEAKMTWIFKDGSLETKVTGGTFTITDKDRIRPDEDADVLDAVFLPRRYGKAQPQRRHDACHQRGRSRR